MSTIALCASVIVPVYNGSKTLSDCLLAINENRLENIELLVVNDRSTDDSAAIAQRCGAHVIDNDHSQGPAGARNAGAEHAQGAILVFADADVRVERTAVARIISFLEENPDVAAVFGSYDDQPAESNFLSQYKNLVHHFVHQNGKVEAVTFWAGFGAIRKDIFLELGGFDEKEYPHPSIEDIELGLRLWKNHHSVRLEKSLQVKHLKRWRAGNLLASDILHRAFPWSKLIVRSGILSDDLNLHSSQRASAVLTLVGIVSIILSLLQYSKLVFIPLAMFSLAAVVRLNRRFYRFFLDRRGFLFVCMVLPWHLFYYLYSSFTFAACYLYYRLRRPTGRINTVKEVRSTVVH